jgi:hypothetical protein
MGLRGTWSIDDPRPVAATAPYTYYLLAEELLAAIAVGDLVKAVFRPLPADRKYDAERMWVRVTAIDGDLLTGELDNDPLDMPQLQAGSIVQIPRAHVIDIDWADPENAPRKSSRRWYWERCMVDECVAEGRCHADYLYREEPDLTRDGDKEPDSGWRIRGTQEAIDADAANGREAMYIALGAVLNKDDRWLHLIDEPVGGAFQWWGEEQRYVRLDPE